MNWMTASILAGIAGASAPLLMVECVPSIRTNPRLARSRRRLWFATFAALVAHFTWLFVDRVDVAEGHRSLAVTAYAVVMFGTLFVIFAHPMLRVAQSEASRAPQRTLPPVAPFRARTDVPALLITVLGAIAVYVSQSDVGYRLKGAGMMAAALTLYFLGRPRAPRTFLAFVAAAAITLFAQWDDPWQRTIGVTSQLAVAVLGFVWCARLLVRPVVGDSANGGTA